MRAVSDDTRYGFAIGRVRAREAALLDDARWDRLIRSRDHAEFRTLLADTAYGQYLREEQPSAPGTRADLESKSVMGKPGTRSDVEGKSGMGKPGTRSDVEDKSVMSPFPTISALGRAAEENFSFFAGYCRDRPVLDAFRIQADIHNLKLAARAAALGRAVNPAHRLGYGRWSEEETERMVQGVEGPRGRGPGKDDFGARCRAAVAEFMSAKPGTRSELKDKSVMSPLSRTELKDKSVMPPLSRAELKDESATAPVSEPEPTRLDAMLDRAAQAETVTLARGNDFLAGIFALRADVGNLQALVRVRLLGEEREELRLALLPGGRIRPVRLMELFNDEWDVVVAKLRPTRWGRMMEDGVAWLQAERSTLRLERLGRELELRLLARARLMPFGFEPLVGFYLCREHEIGNLRRLDAAKLTGQSEAVCAEVVARG